MHFVHLKQDCINFNQIIHNSKSVDTQLSKVYGQAQYTIWKNYILQLLNQTGVIYHGSVNHSVLVKASQNAGFL
jgi:hypothetical protein